jgi:tripartite-type tricarboxylate transporter receptor subunit TctC
MLGEVRVVHHSTMTCPNRPRVASPVLIRDLVTKPIRPHSPFVLPQLGSCTAANTVAEFIELLKSRPGKLTYASSDPGSSIHFAGELFKLMTHTDMLHVPYRGSAPAITDPLAGNVDVMFDNLSNVWPQVQQGALRALGVASLQRTPLAPDVRAIAETVPGYEAAPRNDGIG